MIFKNILRSIFRAWAVVAMAAVSCWGCNRDDVSADEPAGGFESITLRLTTGALTSRADEKGHDLFDYDVENAIKRVTIFLYPANADEETVPAVMKASFDDGTSHDGEAEYTLPIPIEKWSALFGTGASGTCTAYAVVNAPESTTFAIASDDGIIEKRMSDIEAPTIKELKGLKVFKNFVHFSEGAYNENSDKFANQNFIMFGSGGVTLNRTTKSAVGTISVKRLSAKVRVAIKVTPETVKGDDGSEWRASDIGNVKAYFINGVRMARLDGGQISDEEKGAIPSGWDIKYYYYPLEDGDERNAVSRNFIDELSADHSHEFTLDDWVARWEVDHTDAAGQEITGVPTKPYTHKRPFYTYPNTWKYDMTEKNRTYMVLEVPWQPTTGESIVQYTYYQVPFNQFADNQDATEFSLASNNYYMLRVNIGALGSFNIEEPLEIDDFSCEIADWGESDEIDVEIRDHRYLVFNQTEFTMNNTETISIPFTASHTTEIKNVYVTYFRFNDTWGTHGSTTGNEYGNRYDAYQRLGKEEGLLENTTYGNVYARPGYYSDSYYVGREHPKTIDESVYRRPANGTGRFTADDGNAWDFYTEKYGLTTMYDYKIENNKLVFTHPLVRWAERRTDNGQTATQRPDYYVPVWNTNKTGLKDAYSRYEITIEVGLQGSEAHTQIIHITQYPALYITVSHNYGNPSTQNSNKGYYGGNEYVTINGYKTWGTNTTTNWEIAGQGVFGVTNSVTALNGTNNNPNMYVITTTQISEDNDKLFTIGDPRMLTVNNNLSDQSITAPGNNNNNNPNTPWTAFNGAGFNNNPAAVSAPTCLNGQTSPPNRQIRYYYPTDETARTSAGSKVNFIAPSIRVASSFGKIGSLDQKVYARRRCAAYQEAGRPAGRWRLPTQAEVEYIISLSSEEIIPILFGNSDNDAPYWTANGIINVYQGGTSYDVVEGGTSSSAAVRCVYDEWYWVNADGSPDLAPGGDTATTFYWGDKEKENPQQ